MITYRKAVYNDLDELARLRVEFLREVQHVEADEKDTAVFANLSQYLSETLRNGSFIAWLAIDGDRIVGTSGMCFYTLPPSYKNPTGQVAYIMNMYTRPSHRMQGIAGTLFGKLLDEAKSMGYHKICLHATEMGRPIYKKFGFRETLDEMALML